MGEIVDSGVHRRSPYAAPQLGGSLGSSAALVFIGNLFARALGFLFPLLVVHAIGRADFALVIFFISTGFFVGELVLTGYPTAMTRQVAVATSDPHVGRWLAAGMMGGTPLLVASIVIGETLARVADAPPLLITVVILGLTIDAYYFAVLRGLQQYRLLVMYRVGANLAQIVIVAAAASLQAVTVPLVVVTYALVYLIPLLVIEVTVQPMRRLLSRARGWTREHFVDLTKFAVPALVSGVAYGALLGFDVFFVRLLAPHALADYGAARTLAMPTMMLPYAIGVVLLPRAATMSESRRMSLLLRAQAVVLGAGLTIGAVYFLVGPWLISTFLPEGYGAAIAPLRSLVPAFILLGAYSVLSQWWFGINRPVRPALSLALGAVTACFAHVVVTARWGAFGAGVSIGTGALLALVMLGFATWKDR